MRFERDGSLWLPEHQRSRGRRVMPSPMLPRAGGGGGGGTFENQPTGGGWFVLSDQPWNTEVSNGYNNTGGTGTIGTDATAPISPSNVLDIYYPEHLTSGSAPDNHYLIFGAAYRNVYIAWSWRVTDPWQSDASNVNKMGFFYFDDDGGGRESIIPRLYGQTGNYEFSTALSETGCAQNHAETTGNVGDPTLTLNQWYQFEVLMTYGTNESSFNGVLKQWIKTCGVDSVPRLVDHYTDINYKEAGFDDFDLNPTWGGSGGPEKAVGTDDHFYYDHVRVVVAP